jgi:GT2 family glycosyltransferase/LmbE family N-acetylglucosaminyl deacetylase
LIQEDNLIPYKTSALPEGPWLVFAPHPDDETFGMGGTLTLAEQKKIDVTLVILTDGSLGCPETELEDVIDVRKNEVRAVSKRLQLKSVQFWEQPDRHLEITQALVKRVSDLIMEIKPASVFFPSPMELHPDHRTASALVWEGIREVSPFTGKAYAYEISVQCPANKLIDITAVADNKRELAEIYGSQIAERDYLTPMLALNKTRAYTLPSEVRYAEAFFEYEKTENVDLSLHTLNTLKPYWSHEAFLRTPLVTVIIRTVNRPQMLENALRSIAQQSYPEIEALVINDGGKDVSKRVQQFKGVISKVRYIHFNRNQGRSAAANTGLQEAEGLYLMFLDDDDWIYPNHLARLVNALQKDETQRVAYAGVECLNETSPGNWKRVHVFDEPFDPFLLLVRNFIPMHSALFHRELVENDCCFDNSLEIYEDWDFWVQLSRKTRFHHVEGVSAAYRIGYTGGFGVSGDPSVQYQSLRVFFEKWRNLWTYQELRAILGYAMHEVDFRYLKKAVEEKQQALNTLNSKNAEEKKQTLNTLNSKNNEIQALNNEIQALNNKAQAFNERLKEANQKLKETQAELERLKEADQKLKETQAELEKAQNLLKDHQYLPKQIQNMKDDLNKTQALLSKSEQRLKKTQWNLDIKRTAIHDLEKEKMFWIERCQALESSHIWRLTQPIRNSVTALKIAKNRTQHSFNHNKHRFKRGFQIYRNEGLNPLFTRARLKQQNQDENTSFEVPHSQLSVRPPQMIEVEPQELEKSVNQIKFHYPRLPVVTIVIPVFNQVEFTLCCLASISKNLPAVPFEIIVIDDCSTDTTQQLIGSISNINYLRNSENIGFLRSCNRAASKAKGKYLLFLNNDTQVCPKWLDKLVKTFDTVPDVGAVGSKLIYPSGHLQEAGAALRRDGTVELIGLNDHPDKLHYNLAREVDHCSAASLLVLKDLFDQLGGFNEAYAPAYFEDADLSLRIRRDGKKVIYQPESVVIHALSVTTGTENGQKIQQIESNRKKYLDRWQKDLQQLDRVRLIAFYLPQYHPIAENDRWWGKGFTEWTNVTRAEPFFQGHHQPRLPGELGFYDLRLPEIRQAQADLAKEYGIFGFCYYYYWFSGKRLLNRPLDETFATGKPDFPFCVCWANENWSRRWDGLDSEILIEQNYSEADDLAFIKSLAPMLKDPRYIRVNQKPMVMVYRVGLLPDPKKTAEIWRNYCNSIGIDEIYLVSVQSFGEMTDPNLLGFDAAVEFPPQAMAVQTAPPHEMFNSNFNGMFFDYPKTAQHYINRDPKPYTRFRTVMPSWDNTARRQEEAHIFLNVETSHYEQWLKHVVKETRHFRFGDERLVFINAWNEWAEGNYLEPDLKNGRKFLEATLRAVKNFV